MTEQIILGPGVASTLLKPKMLTRHAARSLSAHGRWFALSIARRSEAAVLGAGRGISQHPMIPNPVNSRPTSSRGFQSETRPAVTNETSKEFANHLNKAFGGTLAFPPELAARLLTHASHPSSRFVGHNGRFAFTGEYIFPFLLPLGPRTTCHSSVSLSSG